MNGHAIPGFVRSRISGSSALSRPTRTACSSSSGIGPDWRNAIRVARTLGGIRSVAEPRDWPRSVRNPRRMSTNYCRCSGDSVRCTGRPRLCRAGITNESRKWPVLDVEVFSVENLLHVLRTDFGTLGIRDGRHASHNLRDGFVPINENVAGYWTSTEWVDDVCPLIAVRISTDSVRTPR